MTPVPSPLLRFCRLLASVVAALLFAATGASEPPLDAEHASRALAKSIDTRQLEVAKALIAKGYRLLPMDGGMSALGNAVFDKNTDRLVLILSAIDLSKYSLAQPMNHAASLGRAEAVKLLLAAGEKPSGRWVEGQTPIQAAAASGNTDVIRILVAAGGDVNEVGRAGTALMYAIDERQDDAVKQLLALGADPNKGWETYSPLALASYKGFGDIMKQLLVAGADPDGNPADSTRPLHLVAMGGDVRLIQLLLDAHARTDAKTSDGQTPAELATKNKHPDAYLLLYSASLPETAEHKAKRSEIAAATSRKFTEADLRYDCDKILIDLGGSSDDPNDVAQESRNLRDVRAAAQTFSDCVAAYSKKSIPGPAALVATYKVLNPAEKSTVDEAYGSAARNVQSSIKYGFEFIEARLEVGAKDIDRAAEAEKREAIAAAVRQSSREAEQAGAASDAQLWRSLSAQMQDVLNQATANARPNTMSEADKAEFYARIADQQEDPNSQYNRDKRQNDARAAAQRADDDRIRRERRDADAQRRAVRVAQADTEKSTQAATEARDRAREAADTARKEAEDKAQRDALERDRLAKEADRKAAEARRVAEAARKAEAEAQERKDRDAKDNYLRAMTSGIKLLARNCPDGKGKHYLVGTRPHVKPEVVGCIDVQYRATCEGTRDGTVGVAHNFVGAGTDCFFGDAVEVSPTPACKPAQVNVQVTSVAACK